LPSVPADIAAFLRGSRFAVAGVSRQPGQPANGIFRKLRTAGYEVVPVNPNATELEGVPCYPDLRSIPGSIDGVVAVTHPSVSVEIARQCHQRGVQYLWLHRSIGDGSVSNEVIDECKANGVHCIVGGCPLMFCEPVDVVHRCMKSCLQFFGRVPR
jgi:uncharacterized protein